MYSAPLIIWLCIIIDVVTKGRELQNTASESAAPGQHPNAALSFDLRAEYCHGGLDTSESFFYEQIEQWGYMPSPTFTLRTRPTTVHRPQSQTDLQLARIKSLHTRESPKVEWETVEVLGPDIEDRQTLVQLARMTGNAYALPGKKNWYDIDPKWNNVSALLLFFGLLLWDHR